MAQTHQIENRIRAILDSDRIRKPLSKLTGFLLVLTACTLTAFAGMFSPIAREVILDNDDEDVVAVETEETIKIIPPIAEGTFEVVETDIPQVVFQMVIAEVNMENFGKSTVRMFSGNALDDDEEFRGLIFSARRSVMGSIFKFFEDKIHVISRPVITTLNEEKATFIIPAKKDKKNLTFEVVPQIMRDMDGNGDIILFSVKMKRDNDDSSDADTFQLATRVGLHEMMPLFEGDLTLKSNIKELERERREGDTISCFLSDEIVIWIAATTIPLPKEKEITPLRTVSFTGKVTMPDGTPVRNATVYCFVTSPRETTNNKVEIYQSRLAIKTDENGRCAADGGLMFRGFTPGTTLMCYAELSAEDGEPLPFVSEPVVFDDTGERVWTADHDFTLLPASPVTGTVRYPDGSPANEGALQPATETGTLRPAEGFTVHFQTDYKSAAGYIMPHSHTATTDADGKFTLYLPSGEYRYSASRGNSGPLVHHPVNIPIPVQEGTTPIPFNDSPEKTVIINAEMPTELEDIVLRKPAGE